MYFKNLAILIEVVAYIILLYIICIIENSIIIIIFELADIFNNVLLLVFFIN